MNMLRVNSSRIMSRNVSTTNTCRTPNYSTNTTNNMRMVRPPSSTSTTNAKTVSNGSNLKTSKSLKPIILLSLALATLSLSDSSFTNPITTKSNNLQHFQSRVENLNKKSNNTNYSLPLSYPLNVTSCDSPPPPNPNHNNSNANTNPHHQQQPVIIPGFKASVKALRGHRPYMEDEFVVADNGRFVGVFDGHGGKHVSQYLRANLYSMFCNKLNRIIGGGGDGNLEDLEEKNDNNKLSLNSGRKPTKDETVEAITHAFSKADVEVQKMRSWSREGSTAVACYIHFDSPKVETESSGGWMGGGSAQNSKDKKMDYTIISANVGDSRVSIVTMSWLFCFDLIAI